MVYNKDNLGGGGGKGGGKGGSAGLSAAAKRKAAVKAEMQKNQAKNAKQKVLGKATEVTGDAPRRSRAPRTTFPLPIPGKRNILITSALPYVNNVPHLGNIIGCVLSADVYARFCRQRGHNAVYVCGTDEYGTTTETKARAEGLTPRQICDKYHKLHADVYKWFDIDFDHFGRTSCPEPKKQLDWPQTKIAHEIFLDNMANDNIVRKTVQQVYCTGCNTFLADRMVNGNCPTPGCGYTDARGDQCDKCTKLLNATDLIEPRCAVDPAHVVELRTSEHLFLNLGKIGTEGLEAWATEAAKAGNWTNNGVQITQSWFAKGLEPRCITRDLEWGTPVPADGFRDKVFYVWFDAPIGYISITATATPEWRQWWLNPDNVKLYQFMGKDNVPFHSVIFPGSLMGTGKKWTLLHHLSTTEYLNYENDKFSKSRGVGVFGDHAQETGIPSEVWRYVLLCNRPESSDTAFTWSDLQDRNNNELLKNLGNLVHRVAKYCNANFDSKAPAVVAATNADDAALDEQVLSEVNALLKRYNEELEAVSLRAALSTAMGIAKRGNKYLQDSVYYKRFKAGDKERAGTVVAIALAIIRLLAAVFEPFMPGFADKVYHILDLDHAQIPDELQLGFPAGHKLRESVPVFRFIPNDEINALAARFGGAGTTASGGGAGGGAGAGAASAGSAAGAGGKKQKQKQKQKQKSKGSKNQKAAGAPNDTPDIQRILFKVGKIVDVWHHPEKDGLFCEKIDIGEDEPRTIASGLRKYYKKEDLQDRKIIVICNLKPRKMGDFTSKGMVLCGDNGEEGDGKQVEFADPPAGAAVGERLTLEGYEGEPDAQVNPGAKKNPWSRICEDLRIEDGFATYNGTPFQTSAGPCKCKNVKAGPLR